MSREGAERVIFILFHCILAVAVSVCVCAGTLRGRDVLDRSLSEVYKLAAVTAEAEEPINETDDSKDEAESKARGLKDGEYTGTGQGYGGQITMRLVVKNGTISSLDIQDASHETPAYLAMAKKLIPKIISSGNADVDGVSGATYSSNGIKQASAEAIKKAGGDGSVRLKKAAPKVKGKDGKKSKKKAYKKPSGGWKDGTFTGSARGFGGIVTATVKIKGGKIVSISTTGRSETASYWSRAQAVKGKIIRRQNPKVDAVSGATYSSNGIINAVIDALSKAEKTSGPKSQIISTADETFEITCGGSADLKAKAKTKLSFSSSDSSVVKVDGRGMITGVTGGKAKITITAKKTKKYKKAVKKVSVTVMKKEQNITILGYGAGSLIEFTEGDKGKTLILRGISESGSAISYSSDNESAASVNSSGVVTVNGIGTARITISAAETPLYEAASVFIIIKVTEYESEEDPDGKISGKFTGEGRGYGGKVTVVVDINESLITAITAEGKRETDKYWLEAKKIIPKMIKNQTWDVDAVSGATYSSNGIRDAVKQALEKAGLK